MSADPASSLPLARTVLQAAWASLQRGQVAAAAWVSDPRSAALVRQLQELRQRET